MAETSQQYPEDLIKLPDLEEYEPKSPAEAGRLAAEQFLSEMHQQIDRRGRVEIPNPLIQQDMAIDAFRIAVTEGSVDPGDDEEFIDAFRERLELGFPAWKN